MTGPGTPGGEGGRATGRLSRARPVRAALAECLRQILLMELRKRSEGGPAGGLDLDVLFWAARGPYQRGAPSFWTRGRLERAVDDLVAEGRARMVVVEATVCVHPVPPLVLPARRPARPLPPPQPPVPGAQGTG